MAPSRRPPSRRARWPLLWALLAGCAAGRPADGERARADERAAEGPSEASAPARGPRLPTRLADAATQQAGPTGRADAATDEHAPGALQASPPADGRGIDELGPEQRPAAMDRQEGKDGSVRADPENPQPRQPLVKPLAIDDRRARAILAKVPALARFAEDFTLFDRRDVDLALRRGKRSRGSITAWRIADAAFAWSPAPGRVFWIITGSSQDGAVLAALRPLGRGRFAHAGSAVIAETDTSIAVGYASARRTQLLWTTCFGCPGESGDILLTDEGALEFVYR